MAIKFDYDETAKISSEELNEIKQKIKNSENLILRKFPFFIDILSKIEKNDYFEIHYPLFNYDLSITFSKIQDKYLISILDHKDAKLFGNLLIEGFPCIKISELKKFGEWSEYSKNKLSIFKLNQ